MRNKNVDIDVKYVLWKEKIRLDHNVHEDILMKLYNEEISQDDYLAYMQQVCGN